MLVWVPSQRYVLATLHLAERGVAVRGDGDTAGRAEGREGLAQASHAGLQLKKSSTRFCQPYFRLSSLRMPDLG